jgi:hypothetical protein
MYNKKIKVEMFWKIYFLKIKKIKYPILILKIVLCVYHRTLFIHFTPGTSYKLFITYKSIGTCYIRS